MYAQYANSMLSEIMLYLQHSSINDAFADDTVFNKHVGRVKASRDALLYSQTGKTKCDWKYMLSRISS